MVERLHLCSGEFSLLMKSYSSSLFVWNVIPYVSFRVSFSTYSWTWSGPQVFPLWFWNWISTLVLSVWTFLSFFEIYNGSRGFATLAKNIYRREHAKFFVGCWHARLNKWDFRHHRWFKRGGGICQRRRTCASAWRCAETKASSGVGSQLLCNRGMSSRWTPTSAIVVCRCLYNTCSGNGTWM